MASKQAINQIEEDGVIYEFVDQQARDENTALNKKIVTINDNLKQAISDEENRALQAEQAINNAKVDKEAGKGLSSNDFTDEYIAKIDNPLEMKGATSSDDGEKGMVPKPLAGEQDKYLDGSGNWSTPHDTTYDVVTQSQNGLMSKDDKKKLDKVDTDLDDLMSCNTVFSGNTCTQTFGNGKTKKTTFNTDGSIKVEITKPGMDKITLTTVFNSDGSITRTRS